MGELSPRHALWGEGGQTLPRPSACAWIGAPTATWSRLRERIADGAGRWRRTRSSRSGGPRPAWRPGPLTRLHRPHPRQGCIGGIAACPPPGPQRGSGGHPWRGVDGCMGDCPGAAHAPGRVSGPRDSRESARWGWGQQSPRAIRESSSRSRGPEGPAQSNWSVVVDPGSTARVGPLVASLKRPALLLRSGENRRGPPKDGKRGRGEARVLAAGVVGKTKARRRPSSGRIPPSPSEVAVAVRRSAVPPTSGERS